MVDPSLLDEEGKFKFIPQEVAAAVTSKHQFATHKQSHVIWVYEDGCYSSDGEELIRAEVRRLLGEAAREARVNEVVAHIRETTYTPAEKFNPTLNLVNLKNGILNIETGELTPHASDIIFTSKLPVEFNPDAECPKVGQFLREVLPKSDIPTFVEAIGFCLHRDYFIRRAIILLGEGGNGKSTLFRLVEQFLGPTNVAHIAIQELSGRFAPARLFGRLANIYADLPTYAWRDTGKFKMMTGRDTVDADVKFKSRFSFTNYAKMFFSANRLPETTDETEAFFERLLIITCPNKFVKGKRNPNILDEICTPEELSGLLNAALAGLKYLREQREFLNPKTFEETHDTYIRKSNPIAAFAKDCLEHDAANAETKDAIYEAYIRYCQKHILPAVDKSVFGRKLPSHMTMTDTKISTDAGRKHAWLGIKLCESPNTPLSGKSVQDGQDVQDVSNYYFNILFKIKILNNEEMPGHFTVSDLKRLLFDAFNGDPFKPSQVSQLIPDDTILVRVWRVMDDMRERGELMEIALESGDRAWQLVRK